MQLYAIDQNKTLVFARNANRQQDYLCLECSQTVRLRKGIQRQPHYYHVSPKQHCAQHAKGIEHIQLQSHIQKLLPTGECFLEHRFFSINRIADVVWMPKKIVFEVQCSPITADEVKQRICDYKSEGFNVVWILHDKRYNQWRTTAAEQFLLNHPHYFTNMDHEGKGVIYDQFSIINRGKRLNSQSPFPIDITSPLQREEFSENQKEFFPQLIQERIINWNICFQGDLISYSHDPALDLWKRLSRIQKKDLISYKEFVNRGLKLIMKPYIIFFKWTLEKFCR